MFFDLPQLPYDYKALEPNIDAKTMEIHHNFHHKGYVDNLNKACTEEKIHNPNLLDLLKNTKKFSSAVRNNAGGHYNHSMFWKIMSPKGGGMPSSTLLKKIEEDFGSFESFKNEFAKAAKTRFGSGWAWLCINNKNRLFVTSTPNQDNPLMDIAEEKGYPILCLDVWEHAYYLKYQNRRLDYVVAFWNVINWNEVEQRYNSFIQKQPRQ